MNENHIILYVSLDLYQLIQGVLEVQVPGEGQVRIMKVRVRSGPAQRTQKLVFPVLPVLNGKLMPRWFQNNTYNQ